MSNIQTGAERMPHDLSHLGFLAGQIGRLITISTTPVIAGDSFEMDAVGALRRLLPHLLTLWVCKLLMLICILTKNVITSCSVTMMLFLHLEVKPLMTLTTVLYLSCALI